MATDYKLRITAQDKSKKGFNSVNKNINSTQSAMKKLAGAFAGVFAVRQIVEFGNATFNFILDIANLKILPGDYDVAISSKLISNFKHKEQNVNYWIALEKTSTFTN